MTNWHKTNCERLGIDIENSKRKASFFRIRKNTIGRINEEWAYHKLEDNTLSLINGQTNIIKMLPYTKNKQDENYYNKILSCRGRINYSNSSSSLNKVTTACDEYKNNDY